MKIAFLALASSLSCQIALGQNPGQSTGSPFSAQPPASARNAAEAPRWNPPPQQAAASPAVAPTQLVQPKASPASPGTPKEGQPLSIESPPESAGDAAAPATLPSLQDDEDAPRPIKSVMKSRSSLTQPSGVVPAQYAAPIASDSQSSKNYSIPNSVPPAAVAAPATVAAAPPAGPRYSLPPTAVVPSNPATAPAVAAAPAAVTETPAPPIRQEELPPPTTETTVDAAAKAAARAATDLLANSLAPSQVSNLGDRPLSLLEALSGTPLGSEPNRLGAVRAYWLLSRAFSEYHWAQDELKRLEQIVASRGSIESPMLSTARAAAEARLHDAELAVRGAQESLASASVWQAGQQESGYVPSDQPLVGPYLTYYEMLFANRTSPGRVRQINRILPLRLSVINDRAAAVQSASSAVHYAEEAHARSEVELATVLACHEELHRQRRAFLDAVEQYNVDIAEYAATVAGPGTTPQRLVSMLIRAKQPDRVSPIPIGAESPKPATRGPAKSSTAAASSDGWTASAPRSVDAQPTPATIEPPPEVSQPTPKKADPFAAPATADPFKRAVR